MNQPKMLPTYAKQVVAAGNVSITFATENPYYPTGIELTVPVYKMSIAGNSRVIQWGQGIVPLANLTSRGAARVA